MDDLSQDHNNNYTSQLLSSLSNVFNVLFDLIHNFTAHIAEYTEFVLQQKLRWEHAFILDVRNG